MVLLGTDYHLYPAADCLCWSDLPILGVYQVGVREETQFQTRQLINKKDRLGVGGVNIRK